MKKVGLWIALFLCISLFGGCTKDGMIEWYNEALQEAGECCLTSDRKLEGERSFGDDSWVGTYGADYEEFSGEEIVFGNTALDRKAGNSICVKGKIDGEEGTLTLLWKAGAEEPVVLLEGTGDCSKTLTLPGAGGYLVIEGTDFTGHLEMEVK